MQSVYIDEVKSSANRSNYDIMDNERDDEDILRALSSSIHPFIGKWLVHQPLHLDPTVPPVLFRAIAATALAHDLGHKHSWPFASLPANGQLIYFSMGDYPEADTETTYFEVVEESIFEYGQSMPIDWSPIRTREVVLKVISRRSGQVSKSDDDDLIFSA